jgi:hypothetical protein
MLIQECSKTFKTHNAVDIRINGFPNLLLVNNIFEQIRTPKPTPPEGSGDSSGNSEFQDLQLIHHEMEINLSDPHFATSSSRKNKGLGRVMKKVAKFPEVVVDGPFCLFCREYFENRDNRDLFKAILPIYRLGWLQR